MSRPTRHCTNTVKARHDLDTKVICVAPTLTLWHYVCCVSIVYRAACRVESIWTSIDCRDPQTHADSESSLIRPFHARGSTQKVKPRQAQAFSLRTFSWLDSYGASNPAPHRTYRRRRSNVTPTRKCGVSLKLTNLTGYLHVHVEWRGCNRPP
jgi:hypothetical protein